jgi:hypothetical protein
MWLGLRSKGANRAVAATVARVLVLPWAIFLALTMLASTRVLPPISFPHPWDDRAPFFIGLVIALGVDVYFGTQARRGLLKRFREVAAGK